MAERVGFEPTYGGLARNPISSRARYDRTSVPLRARGSGCVANNSTLQKPWVSSRKAEKAPTNLHESHESREGRSPTKGTKEKAVTFVGKLSSFLPEELPQQLATFLFHHAAHHLDLVIEPGELDAAQT